MKCAHSSLTTIYNECMCGINNGDIFVRTRIDVVKEILRGTTTWTMFLRLDSGSHKLDKAVFKSQTQF